MNIARTERLTLRRFKTSDADSFAELMADPDVMRFSTTGPMGPADAKHWLEGILRHYETHGFGWWAVELRGEGCFLGYCGISVLEIEGRPEHEIGYRLRSAVWGHGYGTEAASAVRDLAFGTLGFPRVVALIDPANTGSIRVAEKIGMHHEKDVMLAGYGYPDRLYAVERWSRR